MNAPQLAEGKCERCGDPCGVFNAYCDDCWSEPTANVPTAWIVPRPATFTELRHTLDTARIRALRAEPKPLSLVKLAQQYGVCATVIANIASGHIWAHIPEGIK